ncbi:hypothetical protein Mal48_04570 [Thalassoglobus polymorphus]|uniref:Uncharacterized protein n=1 Tax=Thalassoglobus polymorphus TaxID=2527994 RepID=A0A517QI03_9PLAN|nr:hypothetical protein Mal48_04570 [Thalassoglobus polymorphus]
MKPSIHIIGTAHFFNKTNPVKFTEYYHDRQSVLTKNAFLQGSKFLPKAISLRLLTIPGGSPEKTNTKPRMMQFRIIHRHKNVLEPPRITSYCSTWHLTHGISEGIGGRLVAT